MTGRLLALAALALAGAAHAEGTGTYANPLPVASAAHGPVEGCADPEVLAGGEGGPPWVLYCTTDPLRADDRDENGDLVFHLVPTFRSEDLVHWTYAGDAFDRDDATATPPPPAYADPTAVFWAPEAERIGDRFYLLFTVTDVAPEAGGEPGCDEDSAIGYAVGDGPLGPWRAADEPLVAPRHLGADCEFLWTIDPEAFTDAEGRHHLLYGSFYGGIEARDLLVAPDGTLSAAEGTAVPITVADRYEGAEVVLHDGFYYLFASATNCCNGPQTGYATFVGRSESPTGPFRDREGVSLLDPRVGGTPVIAQNGNRWVGPGHNALIADRSGQWWTFYHAIDEDDPYFEGETGFTKRPVLLDRIDWVDGWPVLNGGTGPSDAALPAPALRPGQEVAPVLLRDPEPPPGAALGGDEFEGGALSAGWGWVRPMPPSAVALSEGVLILPTADGDLHEDANDAPILLLDAPAGDFVAETRVRLDVPGQGCCFNYVQAGLIVLGDDDNYLKLVVASLEGTRQTEFGRERGPMPDGFPRYGNTVVGPPGEGWTWLRLVVNRTGNRESYRALTSRDGERWVRGGTWTHALGDHARVGLVAMGGSGFAARFDYLRLARPGP